MHAIPIQSLNIQAANGLLQALPITPFSWIPFALVAVITVVIAAAIVYMLSDIIKSHNAKAWSRFQIYEAFLSALLIVAFGSITYLFFLNPQNVFGQLNLVPQPMAGMQGCTGATQLYTLAACDLSIFNNASFSLARYTFYVSYIVGLLPGGSVTVYPLKSIPGVSFAVTTPSLFPIGSDQLLGLLYGFIFSVLILNQLQLIVLSGSLLFLSLFLSIGLVARTMGFTRTFGGAMIAFGLGLGIIYPLLITITYGFIDVNANLVCLQSTTCALISTISTALYSLVYNPFGVAVAGLFTELGYILAGLTFIPVLNIAIVDAFIIDFSSAIGERLSFGELFSSFI